MKKMTFVGRMQAYIIMTIFFCTLTSVMVFGVKAGNDVKKAPKAVHIAEIHEITSPDLLPVVEEVSYE
jgi:hypothetical protein